jgi:hypothetical protein
LSEEIKIININKKLVSKFLYVDTSSVEDKVVTKASWFAKCGLQKVEAVKCLSVYLSFNYKSYIYKNTYIWRAQKSIVTEYRQCGKMFFQLPTWLSKNYNMTITTNIACSFLKMCLKVKEILKASGSK